MDEATNSGANPVNGKPIYVDSYAMFKKLKLVEAAMQGGVPDDLEVETCTNEGINHRIVASIPRSSCVSCGKPGRLSRRTAAYFNLQYADDDDPVKAFKVLKPDGFYIAEDCIPQGTLDAHNNVWLLNEITLVDFLFLYTDPLTLEVTDLNLPGAHLRVADGYTCYRIHELASAARKRILSFELWWHNRCDVDYTKSVNIMSLIKQSKKKPTAV